MRTSISIAVVALVIGGTSRAASANRCAEPLVYCIDKNGALAPGEVTASFQPGEKVVVQVHDAPDPTITVTIDITTISSLNTLVQVPPPGPPGAPVAPVQLAEKVVEIADADRIGIYVVSTQGGNVIQTGVTTVKVRHGLYFARAGLAFTWIADGTRRITEEHAVIEETNFFPAVALSVWPWGHRAKSLSFLEDASWKNSFRDLISFQIGTDLDFTSPFDNGFFGVGLEVISGLGISTGVAVTTGKYFSGAPAGSDDETTDRKMLNPYVALTITSELYDSIRKLADSQNKD